MAALILRVRLLISDPGGASQVFADQDIQDVLDESRDDISNMALKAYPTFSGSTIQYLDYYSEFGGAQLGGWEDNAVLKQYLTVVVTPSLKEPIVGHWTFAASTFPPVYITGALHDVYHASADLLERWAARYMTRFDFASDAQSFHLSQVPAQMQKLALTYRQKQRAGVISMRRSDLNEGGQAGPSLAPTELDRMASG